MAISTIYSQMFIMVLLMLVGYGLTKKEILNDIGANQITSIVLYVFGPAIIIKAFLIPFTQKQFIEILLCFVLSTIAIGVSIIIASLVFPKSKGLEKFGVVFSNAGFMGIPLVQGILGSYQVFYLSIYIVVQNIFAWTYGIKCIDSDNMNFSLWKQLVNPSIIAFVIGIFLFLIQLPIPTAIIQTLDFLGNANTPMAMILLGSFLAKTDLFFLLKEKMSYIVSLLRLVVIPVVMLILLSVLPKEYTDIKYVLLIVSSTPVAAMLTMFSQLYGKDVTYGAKIVSLSNILCLLTMPIILMIASLIWG